MVCYGVIGYLLNKFNWQFKSWKIPMTVKWDPDAAFDWERCAAFDTRQSDCIWLDRDAQSPLEVCDWAGGALQKVWEGCLF